MLKINGGFDEELNAENVVKLYKRVSLEKFSFVDKIELCRLEKNFVDLRTNDGYNSTVVECLKPLHKLRSDLTCL